MPAKRATPLAQGDRPTTAVDSEITHEKRLCKSSVAAVPPERMATSIQQFLLWARGTKGIFVNPGLQLQFSNSRGWGFYALKDTFHRQETLIQLPLSAAVSHDVALRSKEGRLVAEFLEREWNHQAHEAPAPFQRATEGQTARSVAKAVLLAFVVQQRFGPECNATCRTRAGRSQCFHAYFRLMPSYIGTPLQWPADALGAIPNDSVFWELTQSQIVDADLGFVSTLSVCSSSMRTQRHASSLP